MKHPIKILAIAIGVAASASLFAATIGENAENQAMPMMPQGSGMMMNPQMMQNMMQMNPQMMQHVMPVDPQTMQNMMPMDRQAMMQRMQQMPPMGYGRGYGPGMPMMGYGMGNMMMHPQMGQNHLQHMQNVEQRLANIETLLSKLLEAQQAE